MTELRPGTESSRTVLVVRWAPNGRRYWRKEGGAVDSSSVVYGPGFGALADDWPEGTRLVVEARVELPGEEDGDAQD